MNNDKMLDYSGTESPTDFARYSRSETACIRNFTKSSRRASSKSHNFLTKEDIQSVGTTFLNCKWFKSSRSLFLEH